MTQTSPDDPISVDAILKLHEESHSLYGGLHVERSANRDCVEGVVGAAKHGVYYLGLENNSPATDPLHMAAFLLWHIANGHCFADGNKRVAWMAMISYLLSEELTVRATEDEAVLLVTRVASNEMSKLQVIAWLAEDGRLAAASLS